MTEPPTSAVLKSKDAVSVTELFDGGYHMGLSAEGITELDVTFPFYSESRTFSDMGDMTLSELLVLLSEIKRAPAEAVILGTAGSVCVLDINMTVLVDDISISVKEKRTEITLKLKKLTEADL